MEIGEAINPMLTGDSDTMRSPIALGLLHSLCANSASIENFGASTVVEYAFQLADEYLLQSENLQSVSSYQPPSRPPAQRTEGTGRR